MNLNRIVRPLSGPIDRHFHTPKLKSIAAYVAELYGAGEQGAWYDPADLSTLFQDTAGTTPVTAVEQPVGLMRDKSGRGNHATQATTTKRPIYSRRVNLLLDSTTLATQSITTRAAEHRLVFSGSGSVTLSGTAAGVYGAGIHSITCTAGTLLLTVSGAVQDASFHLLIDSHLVYQGINTATDYDADPNKFPAYLAFDGIDDAMQTGNINFTGTDKMTAWAGFTALDMGATARVSQVIGGSNFGGINGFAIVAPNTAGAISCASSGRTALQQAQEGGLGASPRTAVVTLVADQSAPYSINRRDGVQRVNNTGAQGNTGGYGNRPMDVGGDPSARYFTGNLYGLIVRGAQSSLAQIEMTERFLQARMKV